MILALKWLCIQWRKRDGYELIAVAYGKRKLCPPRPPGELEGSEEPEAGRTVSDKELTTDVRGKGILDNSYRTTSRGSKARVMCSAA